MWATQLAGSAEGLIIDIGTNCPLVQGPALSKLKVIVPEHCGSVHMVWPTRAPIWPSVPPKHQTL